MRRYLYCLSVLMLLTTICSCVELIDVDLGKGYKLINSVSYKEDILIVNGPQKAYRHVISNHILDYTYNSVFILAAQRPRDSVIECSGTIPGMTHKRCQEAFAKSTFRQYWIVNKTTDSLWGPFEYEAYLKKRIQVGVPSNLQLKALP